MHQQLIYWPVDGYVQDVSIHPEMVLSAVAWWENKKKRFHMQLKLDLNYEGRFQIKTCHGGNPSRQLPPCNGQLWWTGRKQMSQTKTIQDTTIQDVNCAQMDRTDFLRLTRYSMAMATLLKIQKPPQQSGPEWWPLFVGLNKHKLFLVITQTTQNTD